MTSMEPSKLAQKALVNTVGRIGAPVRADHFTRLELIICGLMTGGGNLTAKGVKVRAEVFATMVEVEL